MTRIHPTTLFTVLSTLLSSCGGNAETKPIGTGGSSQAGGASGQAGAISSGGSAEGGTGTGGSGGAMCGPGCVTLCEGGLCDCRCTESCEDFSPPPYDKSCTSDADCFAGVHTADCCGSKQVLGYNVNEQSRFTSYEADCTARALCRCAAGPPTIESGQVTSDLELRIAICSAGQCLGSGPVFTGGP
jgi:hypothetical protein